MQNVLLHLQRRMRVAAIFFGCLAVLSMKNYRTIKQYVIYIQPHKVLTGETRATHLGTREPVAS